MTSNRTLALALATAGLALIVAGPLLPGGERTLINDPPGSGHVTELARADDGSVLAGTERGELWRLARGTWSRVDIDLDRQPVTALAADLSGDPREGPVGTGGGLVKGPVGLSVVTERVSDAAATAAGLVVATSNGLLVQGDGDWHRLLAGVHVYRLKPQTIADSDYLHAGTLDRGVFTAAVANLADWSFNGDGLPDQAKVFSFAITDGGGLIAGTSAGLYWQAAPGGRWQPLRVGLGRSRVLSLYLAPARDGQQQLWIGSDKGLYRVALKEDITGVEALAYAKPLAGADDGLRYGVSWILPFADGVMFSAGSVYQFGSFGLAGWYWISLLGVVLLLLGGWLFPARASATPTPGAFAG